VDDGLDAFAAWERERWERRAPAYAAGLGDLTRGSAEALLDAAGVQGEVRVLDVGTGPGFVAQAARARGAVVSAVDQSTAMVALARAAGIDATVASIEQIPFPDSAFDAVVGGYVLNHLARPAEAAAELARVLRPGGRVALSVWDLPPANPALGLFGPVAAGLGIAPAPVPEGPDAVRFADDEVFTQLLLGAGLTDVRVARVRWTVLVSPAAWFDAVAAATPRTGALLAAASDEDRAALRARYVEVAEASYGRGNGVVELPAGAVLGSGLRP
jgi:SAM-dependent methyltransferase